MSARRIHVTEHALVRYIERVLGFDLDRHREEIIRLVDKAAGSGAQRISIGGFTYELAHHPNETSVKTILPGASPRASKAVKNRKAKERLQIERA